MKVEKTPYGLKVTIWTWPDLEPLSYNLRQVRTLNQDERHEQKLLAELEKKEAPLTRRFLILAASMENFFKCISIYTPAWWEENPETPFEAWGRLNRMDWNDYYTDGLNDLAEAINAVSLEYCDRSRHGWCY